MSPAAFMAAAPILGAPELAQHRPDLAGCARRLLAAGAEPHHRVRALDALAAWGHDIEGLQTPEDRLLRAQLGSIGTELPSRAHLAAPRPPDARDATDAFPATVPRGRLPHPPDSAP
ncbi:hypothetical protein [Streptomyces sp. NPDC001816]|uniref:hypothetical protein n=1 Tax=Streptomyces sp. NPDC001816 TaxID=3364612 RepID=UPI0036A2E807